MNSHQFSYQRYSLNRGRWRLLYQVIFTNARVGTVSPTPRKWLLKPCLPSDSGPAREMTFTTTGISVAVTHATSGRRWDSVTWQARSSTVLRAGTPGAVRWPLGSPEGRRERTDRGSGGEPGAGSATCPDCACAASGWQALPAGASFLLFRWATAFQPGVLGPTSPTPKPHLPGQAVAARGLGRMPRHA